MIRRAVLAAALCALAAAPSPAAAQEVDLARVEELARLGRTVEARAELDGWWRASGPSAARGDLQRALWLRGTLALDPARAELDFRRLVVEYPGGPFSDLALLRLAQVAHASGDAEGAGETVARLAREHAGSPVVRDAEAWLASAGPAPAPPTATLEGILPADSGRASPAEAPAAPGRFAVQLGAFASAERARSLAERLGADGFEARLVRVEGSDLVRVRIGMFDTRGPADDLLGQLRDLGYPAALAQDVDRERPVR